MTPFFINSHTRVGVCILETGCHPVTLSPFCFDANLFGIAPKASKKIALGKSDFSCVSAISSKPIAVIGVSYSASPGSIAVPMVKTSVSAALAQRNDVMARFATNTVG